MTNSIKRFSLVSTPYVISTHAQIKNLPMLLDLDAFHTCHETCLKENKNECQLCKVPLSMKIKELSESFNESLLDPECAEQPSINNDAPEDEDEPNQSFTISSNRDYSYYRSDEWQEYVETELFEIEISQPSLPHKPAQQEAAELNSPAQPFKQSRCSFCKERGHNKRKCRLLQLTNVELLPQDKTPIPSAVGIPVPQVSNIEARPLAIVCCNNLELTHLYFTEHN